MTMIVRNRREGFRFQANLLIFVAWLLCCFSCCWSRSSTVGFLVAATVAQQEGQQQQHGNHYLQQETSDQLQEQQRVLLSSSELCDSSNIIKQLNTSWSQANVVNDEIRAYYGIIFSVSARDDPIEVLTLEINVLETAFSNTAATPMAVVSTKPGVYTETRWIVGGDNGLAEAAERSTWTVVSNTSLIRKPVDTVTAPTAEEGTTSTAIGLIRTDEFACVTIPPWTTQSFVVVVVDGDSSVSQQTPPAYLTSRTYRNKYSQVDSNGRVVSIASQELVIYVGNGIQSKPSVNGFDDTVPFIGNVYYRFAAATPCGAESAAELSPLSIETMTTTLSYRLMAVSLANENDRSQLSSPQIISIIDTALNRLVEGILLQELLSYVDIYQLAVERRATTAELDTEDNCSAFLEPGTTISTDFCPSIVVSITLSHTNHVATTDLEYIFYQSGIWSRLLGHIEYSLSWLQPNNPSRTPVPKFAPAGPVSAAANVELTLQQQLPKSNNGDAAAEPVLSEDEQDFLSQWIVKTIAEENSSSRVLAFKIKSQSVLHGGNRLLLRNQNSYRALESADTPKPTRSILITAQVLGTLPQSQSPESFSEALNTAFSSSQFYDALARYQYDLNLPSPLALTSPVSSSLSENGKSQNVSEVVTEASTTTAEAQTPADPPAAAQTENSFFGSVQAIQVEVVEEENDPETTTTNKEAAGSVPTAETNDGVSTSSSENGSEPKAADAENVPVVQSAENPPEEGSTTGDNNINGKALGGTLKGGTSDPVSRASGDGASGDGASGDGASGDGATPDRAPVKEMGDDQYFDDTNSSNKNNVSNAGDAQEDMSAKKSGMSIIMLVVYGMSGLLLLLLALPLLIMLYRCCCMGGNNPVEEKTTERAVQNAPFKPFSDSLNLREQSGPCNSSSNRSPYFHEGDGGSYFSQDHATNYNERHSFQISDYFMEGDDGDFYRQDHSYNERRSLQISDSRGSQII